MGLYRKENGMRERQEGREGAKEETEQKSMPDAEIIWHKDRQRQHGSRTAAAAVATKQQQQEVATVGCGLACGGPFSHNGIYPLVG